MLPDQLLTIGNYSTPNRVVLAPMAGVTDKPFRDLCRRLGAGFTVSEMISSDPSLWTSRKSRQRMETGNTDSPHWIQIAGSDPAMLSEMARYVESSGGQILDINMGCPAKKVCRKAAGSALLKDPKLVAEILAAVVDSVTIPVTLKIRTGWAQSNRNALEIARIAEDSGIVALSIHGRTRECKFSGQAEYETIAEVKAAISIPVIANGDISSPEKARQVIHKTGADGVMIGRAAQGKPWLIGDIDYYLRTGHKRAEPDNEVIGDLLLDHISALHRFYGEKSGVRIARKHLGWYLNNSAEDNDFRREFNKIESGSEQIEKTRKYFELFSGKQSNIRETKNVKKDVAA